MALEKQQQVEIESEEKRDMPEAFKDHSEMLAVAGDIPHNLEHFDEETRSEGNTALMGGFEMLERFDALVA